MEPVFLDFETEAIQPRPDYPPVPVGLAVLDRTGGFDSKYYAFAHGSENNSTYEEVRSLLLRILASGRSVCFHNAMFDLCVMTERLGIPMPHHTKIDDTLVLAFLYDPYAKSLSLKQFCKDYLDIQPSERDELYEWILANVTEANQKTAGAYICKAPADLVGKYAMADVRLTAELYDFTKSVRDSMLVAYAREIELMPVLLENSRLGIRVDRPGLAMAIDKAEEDILACDRWLDKYFSVDGVNYNSGNLVVELIRQKGVYRKDVLWPLSPKSQKPVADKDTFALMITDPVLSSVLRYRDVLVKLHGTYLEPFYTQSAKTGRIYTEWNTVRGEHGGTRTGRLSCKPTLQTMPTRGPKTPLPPELEGVEIPKVRAYILPDEGQVMVGADFQAQELRLFAHFEGGKLMQKYRDDPQADMHTFACELMQAKSTKPIIRDYAKTLSFGILYGSGPTKIGEMLGISVDDARSLINLYKSEVAQGLAAINDDLITRYKTKKPFRTIGGRLIKGEPPKTINGQYMEFGYKSLNALIQGSAADMTKQAMINYAKQASGSRLLISLHDEVVISCDPAVVDRESALLEQSMTDAFKLDVPFVASAVVGNNFAEVK